MLLVVVLVSVVVLVLVVLPPTNMLKLSNSGDCMSSQACIENAEIIIDTVASKFFMIFVHLLNYLVLGNVVCFQPTL